MSLNIFDHGSDNNSIKDSFIYNGLHFEIRPAAISSANGKLWITLLPEPFKDKLEGIKGISDDTIELGYSITWGEGPGAGMVKKVKEFTSHEAFKMFGGKNRVSNPATNGWTQQFPSDGSNVSVSWSFRAYEKDNYMNTTSYMNIIKWLTYVTSPLEEFSFNAELQNIAGTLKEAKEAGKKFGQELEKVIKKDSNNNDEIDKTQFEKILVTIEQLLSNLGGQSRGTITFQLGFGSMIKPTPEVDWIISSWDFKPSIQFGPNNMPLYVDFNISMESNLKLTTKQFRELFGIN